MDTPISPPQPPVVESDRFLYRPSLAVEQQLQRLADLQICLARLAGGTTLTTPVQPALAEVTLADAAIAISAVAADPSAGESAEFGSQLPSSELRTGRGRHRDRHFGLFKH